MKIDKQPYGQLADGREIHQWILTNTNGMQLRMINFGAIITNVMVPDEIGMLQNMVLGYDSLKQYVEDPFYIGATIGRVAGRIQHGAFAIGSNRYQVDKNDGGIHHLHGGLTHWNKRVWAVDSFEGKDNLGLRFQLDCSQGAHGYPGDVSVQVTFTLDNTNTVRIDYSAETNAPTILNLTNHSYFNLSGSDQTIWQHELTIYADDRAEINAKGIPSGRFIPVRDTVFDFLSGRKIGERISDQCLQAYGGYDHPYHLRNEVFSAQAMEPLSGRRLTMSTDQQALILYSGNFLHELVEGEQRWRRHQGFCLEAQQLPDAPNHANFPSIEVNPGTPYRQTTSYRFDF